MVTHSRVGAGANVTRTSTFAYNSTTGLLTSETVEPNGANGVRLVTTYTHDSAGNRTQVTQSGWRGTLLPGESGSTQESRTATVTYDANGRYITQRTNAYGHLVERIVTRDAFGSPTKIRDVNNRDVDIFYGALGREYFRRDQAGGFTHETRGMCGSCPSGAEFWVRTQSAGGGDAYRYFDRLGREIRSATKMFNGNWSAVDVEYDHLGRVKHQSEPFETSSPSAGSGQFWTTFVYDALGRVIETRHPDYPSTGNRTLVAYNGFETLYTNGLNQTRKETKNALGELVRVDDHLGGFVTFTYDVLGNLATTTQDGPGVSSAVTTMQHDLLGRKTSMADPNMGNWSYQYNAFGELIRQTTGKGDTTEIRYDRLGRMTRRVDYIGGSIVESDSAWIYDTAANGLGQLHVEDTQVGPSTPIRRTYGYDSFGRPSTVTTEIARGAGIETYGEATTYDEFGRVFQQFDAAGGSAGLEYQYNAHGYVASVNESKHSAEVTETYYAIQAMNARGQVIHLTKGTLTETRQFDPATGRPADVLVQNPGYQTVQELEFDFDVLGNLTWKRDRSRRQSGTLKNITETFQYDDLNRLTDVYQGTTRTLAMSYDALGNITQKRAYRHDTGAADANADVGSYSYGARPHAVTSAGGVSYTYDANGSLISGDGRSLVYGVLNKPISITRGGRTVQIHYGPNRERYRRIDDPGQSSQVETHYVGGTERIWKPGNVVVTKRYLGGQAIHTRTESPSSTTDTLHYLLKDHLGSTHLITDELGDIVQAQSFDAFGLRRHDDDYASLTLASRLNFNVSFTTRGFTGHEGLDPVGLVHMNGRVYDPKLGRFVSGDPFVQDPANTQNHNRYSYVLNNPLSYTDPSGYFFKKLWKGIKKVAGYVGVAIIGAMSCLSPVACSRCRGLCWVHFCSGGKLGSRRGSQSFPAAW